MKFKYKVFYADGPKNDNFLKVCSAGEIDAHVYYMIECCISPVDIRIELVMGE